MDSCSLQIGANVRLDVQSLILSLNCSQPPFCPTLQSAGTGEDAGARFEPLVGWWLRTIKLTSNSPTSPPIAAPSFPLYK
jgi:hypothetical protein